MWESLVPNLPSRNVRAAQEWYRDVLGFGIDWLWEDNFGSVSCEGVVLFLYESEEPATVICSLFVQDVDQVHARVAVSGCEVVSPLEDKPWNVREFTVRDLDGHLLRIGSSVEGERAPELSFSEKAKA